MRNKIQVFGLQCSGTNFVEWSLLNNFEGLDYQWNLSSVGDVKGDIYYGKPQSLKHCYPNLEQCDVALIIERNFDSWDESVKKNFKECSYTKEDWDKYYDLVYREGWMAPHFLHFGYEWIVENYEEFLKAIEGRMRGWNYDVELKSNWHQPKMRLKRDGGRTLSSIPFEYNK